MRKANPWRKFFTKDLYVDEGEPLNAFWGVHIGNNLNRLLGVDGTVFFPERTLDPAGNDSVRYADIPLDQLELHAAPVVQFAVWHETNYQFGTVFAYGTLLPGTLANTVEKEDTVFSIHSEDVYDESIFWDLRPYSKVRFQESDEIMNIVQVEGDRNPYYNTWTIEVERGVGPTEPTYHNIGDHLMAVGPQSISATTYNFSGKQFYVNPMWVEAYLDQRKLRINWLLDHAGTLYFKIFGA